MKKLLLFLTVAGIALFAPFAAAQRGPAVHNAGQ
jgi:hypothetical protein